MTQRSTQSFTELLQDWRGEVEPDNFKHLKGSVYVHKPNNLVVKIIKTKEYEEYADYKKCMVDFIEQVINMANTQHLLTTELKFWNIASYFNKDFFKSLNEDVTDMPDDKGPHEFHPFIVTALYEEESLFDKIEKGEIERWDSTQLAIFTYGCLRAFCHMNSFQLIHDKIQQKKILFKKDNEILFPIYNDFRVVKNAKVSDQLNSFGEILDLIIRQTQTKDKNLYSQFLLSLKKEGNQVQDFYKAYLVMECQIIPKITTLDMEVFNKYKEQIDKYESSNYAGKKSIDSSLALEDAIKDCNGDDFKIAKKIISLSRNNGNPQAAFRVALFYYNGTVLPKDLVSCLSFLRFSIKYNDGPVTRTLMKSLESIRDRGDDDISLFYKGAFEEAIAIELKPTESDDQVEDEDIMLQSSRTSMRSKDAWSEKIKNAINFYTKSLKIKKSPVVMGRLGDLLTNCVDDSENSPGPQLLKLASDANDLHGMLRYALYLEKKEQKESANEIFKRLIELNYIDAAFLGDLYFNDDIEIATTILERVDNAFASNFLEKLK